MSQGFVSGSLLAAGPYIGWALLVILGGATWAAYWLVSTGVERRIWWRIVLGVALTTYLALVFASAVLFVG